MYPWFLWHDRKTSCSWCALSKPFLILQRSIMNSSSLWWTNTNFSISFYRNTFWSFDHTHLCFYTVIYPVENALILAITCLMKPIDLYIGFYILPSNTFEPLFCFVFYFEQSMEHLPQCVSAHSPSQNSQFRHIKGINFLSGVEGRWCCIYRGWMFFCNFPPLPAHTGVCCCPWEKINAE